MIRDFRPAGSARARNAFLGRLREVLPRIGIPTLLLYGDADRRSPVAVGEALHAAIPGSEVVVFPGIGHVVNLEAPDRFNGRCRACFGRDAG